MPRTNSRTWLSLLTTDCANTPCDLVLPAELHRRPFYTEVQVSDLSVRRHRYAKSRLYRLLGDERFASAEGAAAPGSPYGFGKARSLEDYERYCGVSFRHHKISDHARRGGVAPELLAPSWAEEARDEVLSSKCFTDPEVWAGRGNAAALGRQFPETLVKPGPAPELVAARGAALAHVQELLPAANFGPESALQLSRACRHLGLLEARLEDEAGALESQRQALHHADEAAALAPSDWSRSALWRGSVAHAQAAACGGLRRYAEGKRLTADALAAAAEALLTESGEAPVFLAYDTVCTLHQLHEQTDDKTGLVGHLNGLCMLIRNLRESYPDPAQEPVEEPLTPALIPKDAPPPQDHEETLRAKLLEVIILLAMVPGCEEGDELARSIFMDFPNDVRRSPRLQRQLGMIQAGGLLLDVGG